MNRKALVFAGVFLLGVPLAGMAAQNQMILEIDPQKLASEDPSVGLKKCDNLHQDSGSCICCEYHVESVQQETIANMAAAGETDRLIGTTLRLRNVKGIVVVRIDRITPLYRLDSGATFTPAGDWNPHDANGERWTSERAGLFKNRLVASWNDLNRDGLVGPGDELVFDNGEPAKIVNVGVGLHVTKIEPGKSPKAPASQK